MYFLTACMIVVAMSAVVAFRRSRLLPRSPQGRLAAIWPSLCAGIGAMGMIGFNEYRQELAAPATIHLMMLTGAFAGGWLVGVVAEMS